MTGALDFAAITGLLPHRYPMLLVDTVALVQPGVSIVAQKSVTGNEPCYEGMLGGRNQCFAYPYSLIVESMGQAGAILWLQTLAATGSEEDGILVFVGARNMVFEADVFPGDTMEHRLRLEKVVADAAFLSGEIWVQQRLVAQVEWSIAARRPRYALRR